MNDRALAAFQDEMEKIAEVDKTANALTGVWKGVKNVGSRLVGGVQAGAGLASRGVQGATNFMRTTGRQAAKTWHGGRALVQNVSPTQLRKMDLEAARRSRGLTVPGGGTPGTPGGTGVPGGAAGPSFGNTQFGTQHLSGPGGGVKNWWEQASDVQKLKTLGAGVGTVGAYNLAQTGIGGRRSGVQIG
jgi:hypothetical protein